MMSARPGGGGRRPCKRGGQAAAHHANLCPPTVDLRLTGLAGALVTVVFDLDARPLTDMGHGHGEVCA